MSGFNQGFVSTVSAATSGASTVTMVLVEEYRSSPGDWTAQDFTADTTPVVDPLGVSWSASNNTVTATTHGITANGYEFGGATAAEVYIRASLEALVEAGGGPAYDWRDRLLIAIHWEGLDLSGDTVHTTHARIEYRDDYRPRVEAAVREDAGLRRDVLVENDDDGAEWSTGTSAVGLTACWMGFEVIGGTVRPRYSATEITGPDDGSVWDGDDTPERQPRIDADDAAVGDRYLKIGGYGYSAASPNVTWRVTEIVVYRYRGVAA